MTHTLRVSRASHLIFESSISELYAKIIALLGWAVALHTAEVPADAPVLMGRIMLTIEDSLQENAAWHAAWMDLCAKRGATPIEVEVTGLSARPGGNAADAEVGGGGGTGAWPGGGGGGGGAGPCGGPPGGNGADGALVIFEYSSDRRIIDVEAFVTPGASQWICPKGVELIDVIAIGGGGGGGSSVPTRIASLPTHSG